MIKLTSIHGGEGEWINPEHVKKIWDAKHNGVKGTAGIDMIGDFENELPTIVAESPEEVVKKILEHKIIMEEFKAHLLNRNRFLADGRKDDLSKLAGIKTTNDKETEDLAERLLKTLECQQ